jgi:hypothetical protein
MKRARILVEREKTHGDFIENALISQEIKALFRRHGYEQLNPIFREVLDMKAMKLARILSGHAEFKDHWLDDSGYSLLAAEACED